MKTNLCAGALLATLVLAGCGGGGAAPDADHPLAQPLRSAEAARCFKGADGEGLVAFRETEGRCVRTLDLAQGSAGGMEPLRSRGQPLRAQPVFTFETFLAWAEATYPQFFRGTRVTGTYAGYTYRYYPATGHYLAVRSDSTVYALGPATDGEILPVGTLGNLACAVYPANCAAASGDFVPGDASTTAALPFGASTFGTIDHERDQDWYVVTLSAGTAYTFSMEGADTGKGTLSDPMLRIIDSSGQQVASHDDISYPANRNARLAYTPAMSGRYYVAAQAYATATGSYQLAAAQAAAPTGPGTVTPPGGTTAPGSTPPGTGETLNLQDWVGSGVGGAVADPALAQIIGFMGRKTWVHVNDASDSLFYRLNAAGTELAEAACRSGYSQCWIKVHATSAEAARQVLLAMRPDTTMGTLRFTPAQATLPILFSSYGVSPLTTPAELRLATSCFTSTLALIGCPSGGSGVKPTFRTVRTEHRWANFYKFSLCFGSICRYVTHADGRSVDVTVLTSEGEQNKNVHSFRNSTLVWAGYATATTNLLNQAVLNVARVIDEVWAAPQPPTEAQMEQAVRATFTSSGTAATLGTTLRTKLGQTGYTLPAGTGGTGGTGGSGGTGGTGGTGGSLEACAGVQYPGTGEPQVTYYDRIAQFDQCAFRATGDTRYVTDGNRQCSVLDGLLNMLTGSFSPLFCNGPLLRQ